MATARELITGALRLIGSAASGEALSASEANDGLLALNDLLDSWSSDGLAIHAETLETFTWPLSTGSRTIGTAGQFVTTRPDKIDSAFIRDSNGNDTPLELIGSDKYSSIMDKDFESSYPEYLWYNPTFPTGTIYLWPEPIAAMTLGIVSRKLITAIAALTTTITFPPGYAESLKYNLAVRLAPEYGRSVAPEIYSLAQSSYDRLKRVNLPLRFMGTELAGLINHPMKDVNRG